MIAGAGTGTLRRFLERLSREVASVHSKAELAILPAPQRKPLGHERQHVDSS